MENWAGLTIVKRGHTYQRRGVVADLARTADGALLAWVQGTRRYATQVSLQPHKKLDSTCTCPYGATCKHAVAVVLDYLEYLKKKIEIEQAEDSDPRLIMLEGEARDDDGLDDNWDDDDWDDDPDDEPPAPKSRSRKKASSTRSYLQEHTKAELVDLLESIADDHLEIGKALQDRQTLSSGQTRKMLQAVRQEIAALSETDWDDHGYGSPTADLDRLEEHLQALLDAGQADALVRLGPELQEAANQAIELEHEGESSYPLSSCLVLVFQALLQSSLPPTEQLERAVDMELADEYSLCDDGAEKFWKNKFAKEAWGALADRLHKRLEKSESPTGERDFSSRYQRDKLSNWLISALANAGRNDEIIPLCQREAPITGSYERLIVNLMEKKRWEEAERWCLEGIQATESTYPGMGSNLRQHLRTVIDKRGDRLRAVASYADEFFHHPSLRTFEELGKAARKVRQGPVVEAWAFHYLEMGQRPQPVGTKRGRKRKGDPQGDWPLPVSGMDQATSQRVPAAPMTDVLLQIALNRKDPDEVLKWYDHAQHRKPQLGFFSHASSERVAEAVKQVYPDRSIAIWKEIAEGYIARTEVKAYETAGRYLCLVKDLMIKNRQKGKWEDYLKQLREGNRRKPRCVDVLDRLAGKGGRIIDS